MNNIEISAINVCPCNFFDESYHDMPMGYDVDERRDFIYDNYIVGLVVAVQAVNTQYGNTKFNATAQSYILEFCDGETVLAKTTFTMKMEHWVCTEVPRLGMTLAGVNIECGHVYELRLTKSRGTKPLISLPIRFFDEKYLGSRSLLALEGYVSDGFLTYRNIKFNDDENYKICFKLKNLGLDWNMMPEMLMTVHGKDGKVEYLECDIERSSNPDEDIFVVSTPFTYESGYEDVVYARLEMFGENIGGIIFTTDQENEYGSYKPDEFESFPSYSSQIGLDVVEYRKMCKSRDEAEKDSSNLDSLVGLENVKAKIRDYVELVKFNKLREAASLPYSMPPLHAMFTGSPGTGKTTVAKIMGKLLKDAGVLSKGHVVVRERATLLGQNYSSESEHTLEALEAAQGGILFIDEAYQLYQPQDAKDPGKFVIETLLTALADESNRDWMLILAGYTKPMQKMFDMNPGLASRIPSSNIYEFNDYNPQELMEIATRYFSKYHYELTTEAAQAVKNLIESDYANRNSNFGNGRHVMNVIETGIIPAMARRVMSSGEPSGESLSLIEAVDIPQPIMSTTNKSHRVGFATR